MARSHGDSKTQSRSSIPLICALIGASVICREPGREQHGLTSTYTSGMSPAGCHLSRRQPLLILKVAFSRLGFPVTDTRTLQKTGSSVRVLNYHFLFRKSARHDFPRLTSLHCSVVVDINVNHLCSLP